MREWRRTELDSLGHDGLEPRQRQRCTLRSDIGDLSILHRDEARGEAAERGEFGCDEHATAGLCTHKRNSRAVRFRQQSVKKGENLKGKESNTHNTHNQMLNLLFVLF